MICVKVDIEIPGLTPEALQSVNRNVPTEKGVGKAKVVDVDEQIQELNDRFMAQLEEIKNEANIKCEELQLQNQELKLTLDNIKTDLKKVSESVDLTQKVIVKLRTDITDLSENVINLPNFKKTYKDDLEIIENNHDIVRKRITTLENKNFPQNQKQYRQYR